MIAVERPIDSRYGPPPARGVRRFSVEEYHQLIRQGFFAHDERFELIEGFIVPKMPRDPIHDAAIEIAIDLFHRSLPSGWRVRSQLAVTLSDSEPEPDLAIVSGDPRTRMQSPPNAEDVALVIEVANSSLRDDRDTKGRIYAREGVREYWIINLIDRQIERYIRSGIVRGEPAYLDRTEFYAGENIALSIPGHPSIDLAVTSLMP